MDWSNNSLEVKNFKQIEKAFSCLLVVFVKLVLQPIVNTRKLSINWPAVQGTVFYVSNFVTRNVNYAKPTDDPIYRQQSFTEGDEY